MSEEIIMIPNYQAPPPILKTGAKIKRYYIAVAKQLLIEFIMCLLTFTPWLGLMFLTRNNLCIFYIVMWIVGFIPIAWMMLRVDELKDRFSCYKCYRWDDEDWPLEYFYEMEMD
jgi:hypothetical protein